MRALATPVCEMLGCRYPIILAGMGGVARSELVGAVSEAGGFGFLGMVRESPALIASEVEALRRRGVDHFGVNLIPAATPPDLLEAELTALVELEVPVVALFWEIDRAAVRRLRDAGIMVVYQVGSTAEAREAVAAGAQILIAQGVEAGGHVRGTTPLFDLLPALVDAVAVPVLAAGGIADAGDIAAVLALGAEGAVLGTAMIATPEAFAHDVHKQRLLAGSGGDTVLTDAFHINWPTGARVRVLDGPVTRGERGDPWQAARQVIGSDDGRPIYLFSTDSPLRSTTGELETMPLYAGMGVGRVTGLADAAERLRQLVDATEALLALSPSEAEGGLASAVCYAGVNPEFMGYLGHAALLEALAGLHRQALAALRAAPRGSLDAARYARWAMLISGVCDELGGAPLPLAAAAAPSAGAGERLVAEARALLPKIFEERVRQVLDILLGALLSDAVDAPAAPPAGAAPTPPETPPASGR